MPEKLCLVHNLETEVLCKYCNTPICSYCAQELSNPNVCLACEKRALRQKMQELATKEPTLSFKAPSLQRLPPVRKSSIILVVLLFVFFCIIIYYMLSFSATGKNKIRIDNVAGLLNSNSIPRFESRYLVQLINGYYLDQNQYPEKLDVLSPRYITPAKLKSLNERYSYELDERAGFIIRAKDPEKTIIHKEYLTPRDNHF